MLRASDTKDLADNQCCSCTLAPFPGKSATLEEDGDSKLSSNDAKNTSPTGSTIATPTSSEKNDADAAGHRQNQDLNKTALFTASTDDHDETPEDDPEHALPQEHPPSSQPPPPPSPQPPPSSPPTHLGPLQRAALRCAQWPKTHFWVSMVSVLVLTVIAMLWGEFTVDVSNVGWPSRGTLIANRQMQLHLLNRNRNSLSRPNNDCLWEDLTTVVQLGWQSTSREEADKIRATERNCTVPKKKKNNNNNNNKNRTRDDYNNEEEEKEEEENPSTRFLVSPDAWRRHLEEHSRVLKKKENDSPIPTNTTATPRKNLTAILDTCDVKQYMSGELLLQNRLWPVWRVKDKSASALDPPVLKELCQAEEQTQRLLEQKGYCGGCSDGTCLPPYSPVLYARFMVPNGFTLDCSALAEAWAPEQAKTEERWKECVSYLQKVGTLNWVDDRGPCPDIFAPSLVDENFLQTGRVEYTSSIFVSDGENLQEMYNINGQFGRGSQYLEAAYDTQQFFFLSKYAREVMVRDVVFAMGSAIVTALAMLVHTRSPFLTLVAMIEISLSFPLAYGAYRLVMGGLTYFPFLNLVGIFVSFAMGGDHVFVAVDKWKNARRENPSLSTEEIAVMSLPSAARAMAMTTTTTAMAFFGSSMCAVANIRLFAIFCGLLVILDYIVDVLVMFPCLCIYDGYRHQNCCWVDFRAKSKDSSEEIQGQGLIVEQPSRVVMKMPNSSKVENGTPEERKEDSENGEQREARMMTKELVPEPSSVPEQATEIGLNRIQRILTNYYNGLHMWRWPLFLLCLVAIGACCYIATKLEAPETPTELPLMISSVEFEKARQWRQDLLTHTMLVDAGSEADVVWGLTPADTGDHNNPYTMTTLVLDDSFDPSTPEAQVYLQDYCNNLMTEEFGGPSKDNFVCPLNQFDEWLVTQSSLARAKQDRNYRKNCAKANSLPVPKDTLHACLSSWAQQVGNVNILAWNGTVKIITVPFQSRIRFDSATTKIEQEWHLLEDWVTDNNEKAPPGLAKSFFSSLDYWWWDTAHNVYNTALSSGLSAIAVTAVVIAISSQSITMTFFSAVSVLYVLASVTTMMVACGWTLGFLESICFTILIGISGDFVVHFSHAYAELHGTVDRHTRTKYALLHLGPSVLAAGFTTLAGALLMLFAIIYFFRAFAFVLFCAVIQAAVGSFVVFLVFTDCMGPSNPKYLYYKLTGREDSPLEENDDAKEIPGISYARTEETTAEAQLSPVILSIAEARTGEENEGTETQAELLDDDGEPWDEQLRKRAPDRKESDEFTGVSV